VQVAGEGVGGGNDMGGGQLFYSGKHHKHRMNLQIIASLAGKSCGYPSRCPGTCII
jgi:hypothetical protein